jgi:hypothetical protein
LEVWAQSRRAAASALAGEAGPSGTIQTRGLNPDNLIAGICDLRPCALIDSLGVQFLSSKQINKELFLTFSGITSDARNFGLPGILLLISREKILSLDYFS